MELLKKALVVVIIAASFASCKVVEAPHKTHKYRHWYSKY
jgi:hypothetical protein